MAAIIFTIIFALLSIISIVLSIVFSVEYKKAVKSNDDPSPAPKVIATIMIFVFFIISAIILTSNMVIKVDPYEIAIAYYPNGESTVLHTGYNVISPMANIGSVSTQTYKVRFSEGHDDDNIYGAQTSEKDYIQIVSTISYRIDPDKVSEYVTRYKYESADNAILTEILKTESRSAIERVIGSKTTSDTNN